MAWILALFDFNNLPGQWGRESFRDASVLSRQDIVQRGRRILASSYAFAAADQLAISLINFGMGIALVRLLSAAQFGTYSLWAAVVSLALGAQSALVCTPFGVHVPAQADMRHRQLLESALGTANLIYVALASVTVLLITAFGEAEWIPADILTRLVIPAFVATELYREYCRSVAFGRNDMTMLMLVDAPYAMIAAVFIGSMLLWPEHFATLGRIFLALTLGGAVGRLCASFRLRIAVLRQGWTKAYKLLVNESMWMLVGVVSTHIQARSYTYIATALVGLAQLGSINAVGLLFRPAQTMLIAWRRATLPELSRLWAAGDVRAYDRRLFVAVVIAIIGIGLWVASLWFTWRLIEHYVLGVNYPEAAFLLLPWTMVCLQETIAAILATGLQASREFRFLAQVTVASAPVAAVAMIGLTIWHGYTWILYGLAVGHSVNLALLVGRLWRVRMRRGYEPLAPGAASASDPARG